MTTIPIYKSNEVSPEIVCTLYSPQDRLPVRPERPSTRFDARVLCPAHTITGTGGVGKFINAVSASPRTSPTIMSLQSNISPAKAALLTKNDDDVVIVAAVRSAITKVCEVTDR